MGQGQGQGQAVCVRGALDILEVLLRVRVLAAVGERVLVAKGQTLSFSGLAFATSVFAAGVALLHDVLHPDGAYLVSE